MNKNEGRTPLKLGFIGGGLNSAIGSAHFAASMLDDRFRVVSGCFSRDESVNLQTAQRWHIDPDKCQTNWRRYLTQATEELDALCILTPIPDHYEMVVESLDAGIPVICEKALVPDAAQANSLLTRYESAEHFVAVTLNYSGYPVVRLLRDLVAQGRLGKLQQVHMEMPLENYTRIPVTKQVPATPQGWRQKDGVVPTLLLDLGTHLHHLLHFITGVTTKSVMAQFSHFSTLPDIVDDARIWAACDDDIQVSMWMSKTALGHRNGMRIRLYGDSGSAEWYQFEPEILHMTDKHGARSQLDRGVEHDILQTSHYNRFKAGHPSGYIEAFGNLYWDIADSLEQYKQSGVVDNSFVYGMEHSAQGLEFLEAAAQSNRVRRWVDVESTAPETQHNATLTGKSTAIKSSGSDVRNSNLDSHGSTADKAA